MDDFPILVGGDAGPRVVTLAVGTRADANIRSRVQPSAPGHSLP
jgi:hypothetical protein